MLDYTVNFTSVIVSAIVAFILGFVWWGPLFGMTWAKLNRMTANDMKKAKEKGMARPMIVMIIANILMSWVLSVLLLSVGATTINAALSLACFTWLGFVATIGIGIVLWENKPMSLFWINSLGWLVTLLAMAITQSLFW